ncbi:MAG: ThuA domain-containing protein [Fibrobacteria bacterium]|nr:ThuA domain-containing protein [Fibrobacteria bacterium]
MISFASNRLLSVLAIFVIAVVILCGCSAQQTAGTGTETSTISGTLYTVDNEPAAGVEVYLRSADYQSTETGGADYLAATTKTNGEGFFTFSVEDTGAMIIEAIIDSSQAVRISLQKNADSFVELGKNTIAETGVLRGRILLPSSGFGTVLVQLLGSERYAVPDSVTGEFLFLALPAGRYVLRYSGAVPLRQAKDTLVEVLSGETTTLPVLTLGEAEDGSEGILNGSIQLPDDDSGSVIATILSESLELSLDDSGAFSQRLSPGEYIVHAWGVEPPRDTVSVNIMIKPGRKTSDIVVILGEPLAGQIVGQVGLPQGSKGTAAVALVGLDSTIIIDSTGRFTFTGLSQGSYTIKAWGVKPERDTVKKTIEVKWNVSSDCGLIQLKTLSVLIVDGINNHDWQRVTGHYATILESTGFITVDTSTTPAVDGTAEEWDAWRPVFTNYDAVIINFNDQSLISQDDSIRWPAEVEQAFATYVSSGGGVVISHSASGVFYAEWQAMNEMRGLRSATIFGSDEHGYQILDNGIIEMDSMQQGIHELVPQDSFLIMVPLTSHPITESVPEKWLHPSDGFQANMRGSVEGITLLSYAEFGTPVRRHPVEWVKEYGNGRVYVSGYGHIHERHDNDAHRCIGFQTLFIRGVEWVATGRVSHPVPDNFPTEASTSLNDNLLE